MYTDDVDDMDDLEEWLTGQNESALSDYLDVYRKTRASGYDSIIIRFTKGDHLNGPARVAAAVQGTDMEFDHISVESPMVRVVPSDQA